MRTVKETVARLHDLPSSGPVWLYQSWRVCSALALKISSQSPRVLRQLMGDALSDLAGRPLPVWSWLKASLPSSLGWLNLRQASVHASAAYIGSLHQSRHLVAKILGRTAPQSTFPTPSNPWPELHADQIGSPSRTFMFLSPNIPFHGLPKPLWPLLITLVQSPCSLDFDQTCRWFAQRCTIICLRPPSPGSLISAMSLVLVGPTDV